MIDDFTTPLFAAGLSLAEKIIFSWFEHRQSKIKQSQIDKEVGQLARVEADRRRLREDDLAHVTSSLLQQLIASSPNLVYDRTVVTKEPTVRFDVDVSDPSISKALLHDLQARLNGIAQNNDLGLQKRGFTRVNDADNRSAVEPAGMETAAHLGNDATTSFEIYEAKTPNRDPLTSAPRDKSKQLLDDLQRRLAAKEEDRR